jgi:Putative addiction module component
MSDPVLELAAEGRRLTPEDRSRLVDLLQESLVDAGEPAVAEAWDREIERRIAANTTSVNVKDWEDAIAEQPKQHS